jgi:hypothetical protein
VTDDTYVKNYVVSADKSLAQYVTFETVNFENVPPRSLVPINGKIIFPESLNPPGGWDLYICVTEDCPAGAQICGRGSACAALNFMVLYPGIMPIISLGAKSANPGEPIEFTVSIENIGKDEIRQASGYIDIFNLNKEKVGTAFLESKSIRSGAKDVLKAIFETTNLLSGNYSATAFVNCDGNTTEAKTSFRIGKLDVKIIDYNKEIESGAIKKFVTKVESFWNDPLEVYANIRIYDKNHSVTAKTATNKIEPWKTIDMDAFIDTTTLEPAEYDIKIDVFYGDASSTLEGKILVKAPIGPPVNDTRAPEEEKPGLSTTNITIILVIIVALLTIVNIFIAVYRKKK